VVGESVSHGHTLTRHRQVDHEREAEARRAAETLKAWAAGRNRSGVSDQDPTALPAPRHPIVGKPGCPWPIGRLAPFIVPVQPTPQRGAGVLPPTVHDRSRPVGRTPDHERAVELITQFQRGHKRWPTKREAAAKFGPELGYAETWWHERIKDAQQAAARVAVVNGSRPTARP